MRKLKRWVSAAVLGAASMTGPAWAATFNFTGTHLTSAFNSIPIQANSGGAVGVLSAVGFDPTSTVGGEYNRLYFTNREGTDGGLYMVDVPTGTVSGPLTLNSLTNASSLSVANDGTVYVGQDTGPQIWRVESPLGAQNLVQMLGNYNGATDDDPIRIDVIPSSNRLFVFDQGLDNDQNEALVVVDPTSTAATPVFSVVWTDGVAADNNLRGAYSQRDGLEYMSHTATPIISGNVAIFRFDEAGNRDTILLDGLTTALSIDDSIAVNPQDGSVWLPHNAGGSDRVYYRVDVAAAMLQSPGVYLAPTTQEFTATAFNVGVNSLTFSPDGKWLAAGSPDGADTLYLLRTTIPEPTAAALVLSAIVLVTTSHVRLKRWHEK